MVYVKFLNVTTSRFCDDMGTASWNMQVDIINIEELFGIRFVRLEKRIDLVVTSGGSSKEELITGVDRKAFDLLELAFPIWKFLFGGKILS